MKIVIVTFDYFTDLDVFLPWDLLNRVRLVGNQKEWEVKIIGTKEKHVSMAGLEIPTHGGLEEMEDADAIIFSSGTGVQTLLKDEQYFSRLKLNPERQLIGSMCSGALLLGKVGLLTGKKATTYPTVVHQLREFGVEVVNESFVREGNLATAAGCLAGQDLSAWIIEELIGKEMVELVLDTIQPVS